MKVEMPPDCEPVYLRSGEIVGWFCDQDIRAALSRKEIVVSRRNRQRRLVLSPQKAFLQRALSGSRAGGTKYSHNRAVSDTFVDDSGQVRARHPLDVNIEKVWHLKRILEADRNVFTEVMASVLP